MMGIFHDVTISELEEIFIERLGELKWTMSFAPEQRLCIIHTILSIIHLEVITVVDLYVMYWKHSRCEDIPVQSLAR